MMTVGDDTKPTKGTPPIDMVYDAPALAPAEDAPEEPGAAADPEGEPAPAEEASPDLKTPDEYAPADDGTTEADLEALGLKASAEIVAGKPDNAIDGKILEIEGGSGDLEEIAGLLIFELDRADVSVAQRKIALARLVKIHNAKESTEEQRGAVKHAFKNIRSEGSEGLFSLAMVTSAKLEDDCEELAEYIKVFAGRVQADGDGAYKNESHAAFIKSVRLMAEKNPSGTKPIIDGLINLWFEKPSTKALWNALMAIADTNASYTIEAEEGKVDVTMKKTVVKRFMGNYRDLPEEERIEIAGMIVLAMGEEVPKTHVDIIRGMIKKGPDPVRTEILRAVRELDAKDRKGEIEVDRHAMLEVYASLIDQAEDGCFSEGECDDLLESLIESRSRYAYLLDFSAALSAHSLTDLAGQPMDVSTPGVGYNLEWMSSEYPNGMRLLLGTHYTGWVDHHAVGVSVGTAYTSGKFYVKLRAAFDYLYLKGVENGLDDVPVELADPQITADGTAYRMIPHEMDFIMNAAMLMLKPEIGYVFHRWHLGGGKTLGIKGFLGLHAGLFAGNVYDDGCSYSYDPAGDDSIHVSPTGGGNAVVVQETELGTRCRSGEPVFGSIFGAEIGFGLEWGL